MKQKKYYILTFIVLLIIIAFGSVLFLKLHKVKPLAEKNDIKYQNLVTVKDRAPIPSPANGHFVKIPILMYHHVGNFPQNANSTRKDLTVSVSDFEQQTAWLKQQNFTSISLENVYQYSLGKFMLPKNPIVFTFDDGYLDAFENAVPILEKNGFTGSFGIISQWPGQTMGDNIYASWDTIVQAKQYGMEIVCHTQNHFDGTNPKYDANYIYDNLHNCQKDLTDHLGLAEPILIYPYGHYTPTYIEQAKKAGFVLGITVHEDDMLNLNNLMEIPRVRVHGAETLERFKDILLHKKIQTAPTVGAGK